MDTNTLKKLRSKLAGLQLDGMIIPRADAWPGEFISERAERLKFITGFSGSAGCGILLKDKAGVLTDGRYQIQVREEVDKNIWQTGDITKVSVTDWLKEHATENAKIGYDPYLHSTSNIQKWEEQLNKSTIKLVPLATNPIDDLWITGRPAFSTDPVSIFPEEIAGQDARGKIADVTKFLKENGISQYLFTAPDSICWLLNIRGNDVVHTPVALSYALIEEAGALQWFIDPKKVPDDVRGHLPETVSIKPISDLQSVLSAQNSAVGLDESICPVGFGRLIAQPVSLEDPCLILKACKNEREQAAIRKAHLKDAVALIDFHRWIKDPKASLKDELTIEQHLHDLRKADAGFQSPSFDTIAGWQENGAIIHYRANERTNKKINGSGLLLVDSGGQYLGEDYAGTTDVTRTYILGEPTTEQRRHYTLVLKAHIAIARAKFPYGTTGAQIDALARAVLWEEGLDFQHGLGHGVGCYLSVHEDSANLSPRGTRKLEPGMLLSNEPGLYFEGKYGIRIENLMFVQKTGDQDNLGRDMLCFETVTLAAYDNDLIDFSMMNAKEMRWIEAYYREIEEKLS